VNSFASFSRASFGGIPLELDGTPSRGPVLLLPRRDEAEEGAGGVSRRYGSPTASGTGVATVRGRDLCRGGPAKGGNEKNERWEAGSSEHRSLLEDYLAGRVRELDSPGAVRHARSRHRPVPPDPRGGEGRAAGAERIGLDRIRVGRMTGVVPEALEQAFRDPPDRDDRSDAALDVEYVPAPSGAPLRGRVRDAGADRRLPDVRRAERRPQAGREMDLVSLEVD